VFKRHFGYHLSIYLSVCLFVCLSVCLSIHPSIYLSIYLHAQKYSDRSIPTFAKDVFFTSFVCLLVSRIMQKKLLGRFSQNLVKRWHTGCERIPYILVVILTTLRQG